MIISIKSQNIDYVTGYLNLALMNASRVHRRILKNLLLKQNIHSMFYIELLFKQKLYLGRKIIKLLLKKNFCLSRAMLRSIKFYYYLTMFLAVLSIQYNITNDLLEVLEFIS